MEEVKYRFFATSRTGTREVFPKNGNALVISWEKEQERAFYTKQLKGKMLFTQGDFHWFYTLENSEYRCDVIDLMVQKKCGGEYTDYIPTRLLLNIGDWDIDQCTVQIEAKIKDRFTCYEDSKDIELNMFNYVTANQSISFLKGTIESIRCAGKSYTSGGGDPAWCGSGSQTDGWTIQSYSVSTLTPEPEHPGGTFSFDFNYVREVITSVTPLSSPWINIGGNQYARIPALYGLRRYSSSTSDGFDYKYGGGLTNGMKLRSIFEMFAQRSCGMGVKSDFFQWNPDVETNINYVTGQPSKVLNLILFQKSDVKRPDSLNKATVANQTWGKMLADICNFFNLRWDIDEDNRLVIEHVSFFAKDTGLNLIDRFDKNLRAGFRKYSYDTDNMPRIERFTMLEDERVFSDFKAQPIVYSGECVGQGTNGTKDYNVESFTTAISYVMNNPLPESPIVSDDGFVLVACDVDNSILSEASISGAGTSDSLNNTLSFSRVLYDYWRHGRVLKNFLMNNVPTEALSVRRTKKQVAINATLCCEDFNPDNLIVTDLGNGEVDSASFDLYKETLTLNLLYEAGEFVNTNEPPVAVPDTAETFENITIDIDVLDNDTDSDGTINPGSIEIVFNAHNGLATVVDNKIRYKPNINYVGTDNITYRIRDDFNEPSNNAEITITVKEGSPLPVAGNDAFISLKNQVLNVGNVLDNDSGDGDIEAVPETKATSHGNVQIFANGSFTYTPNTDYVGADSFEYTLKDSNDNTATGTVTLTIIAAQTVYVRYSENNINNINRMYLCGSTPKKVGEETRIDQHLKFYSDSAGTIPLNVTGYGLSINFETITTTNGTPVTSDTSIDVTGTSYDNVNVLKNSRDYGCDGIDDNVVSKSYSILYSPNYIIL